MDSRLDRKRLEPGTDRWQDTEITLLDRHCFLPYYTTSPWGGDGAGEIGATQQNYFNMIRL